QQQQRLVLPAPVPLSRQGLRPGQAAGCAQSPNLPSHSLFLEKGSPPRHGLRQEPPLVQEKITAPPLAGGKQIHTDLVIQDLSSQAVPILQSS
ncbi:unnamed protein product, partial [Coccothraustes coccothraustes]